MGASRFLLGFLPVLGLFLLLCGGTGPAYAACASPAGDAGDLIWSSASNAPAYCNDTDWVGFPKVDNAVSGWTQLSIGEIHACGIRSGALYCWGSNSSGKTGQGVTSGNQTTPAQVGTNTDWVKVAAEGSVSCGIRASGALYCWGGNGDGATGQGTTTGNTLVPTQVGTDTAWTDIDIANGTTANNPNTTCGINAGALYCWGGNGNGLTGQGLATGVLTTPTQVGTDTDWVAVAIAGGNTSPEHGCGLRAGALYCWGENQYGVTGLGTTAGATLVPTQVGVDTDWTYIVSGIRDSCGIRGGALYCWGDNASGNPTTPTQQWTDTDWVAVALKSSSARCGLRASGSLYCWGFNGSGTTAQGTTSGTTSTPTQVGSDNDWSALELGGSAAACAAKSGALYCWGSNAWYLTAQGTNTGVLTIPTAVPFGASSGCANPVGDFGDVLYNSTHHVLQYCDGTAWVGAGPVGNGGAGCVNPSGDAGDVVYNSTHHYLQYCEGDDWIGIGRYNESTMAPKGCPVIGDTCSDGTIYAGLTPDGNVRMYITAANGPSREPFNVGNVGASRTDTSMINCVTPFTNAGCIQGEANTAILVVDDSDSVTAGVQSHDAAVYCYNLVAHGRNDWYLPARNELRTIFDNLGPVPNHGFTSTPDSYYYSSSEESATNAWGVAFVNGNYYSGDKANNYHVRCARK